MKRINTLTTALTAALCCLICLLTGCTRDNDIDIPQTSVHTMDATTVQPGENMTLTGQNMHLISKVYFGTQEVKIETPQASREQQSLTVIVPTGVFEDTQVVPLSIVYNSVHRIVVCEELTVYIAPVIPATSTTLSGEVKPSDIITITGTDLNIITSVLANTDAVTITSKTATAIAFKAPEVDADTEFTITLVYDNSLGTNQKLVVPGKIMVKEIVPEGSVTDATKEVEAGKDISIEGTNLNIVSAVRLTATGAEASDINIVNPGATGFSFKAPKVEADTEFTVTLIYGRSNKEKAAGKVMVKKVAIIELPYHHWEGVTLGAGGTECALFNAVTGKTITPCELFDQQTNVDFAMDATSSAAARLLNPANINDAFMKAQVCGGTSLSEDGKSYDTLRKTLKTQFKLLNTGNATENALIQKVMNGEITDVKEDIGTLTISTNTPTVEASSVLVFKNTNKDKVGIIWVKAVTLGEKKDLNTISMDVYYEK